MDKFKKKNSKFALTVSSLLFCVTLFVGFQVLSDKLPSIQKANADDKKQYLELSPQLKSSITSNFKNAKDWPKSINTSGDNLKINYTFNPELTGYIERLLSKYRSDYSTVVVIDNETGEVLAAVGHEGRANKFNTNLVLSSTHPAASLGKIITAADLVEHSEVTKDTKFYFRGKSTTLYKYQVNQTKQNKWDKAQSLEMAFAVSNNVIFGKAAIEKSTIGSLSNTAKEFGFNTKYMNEFDFMQSEYPTSITSDFNFAEVASGFTRQTNISPIHAAMMASVVANNGFRKTPMIIKNIENEDGKIIWENVSEETRILTNRSQLHMKDMMESTVRAGTARKSFRKLKKIYKDNLDIGGKTGSLTGGQPFGKRDWFAFYAIPQDSKYGKGISVSVMNVNQKKWYVKSSVVAKEITEYYYGNIVPIKSGGSQKSNIADKSSKSAFVSRADLIRRNPTSAATSQLVSTRNAAVQKKTLDTSTRKLNKNIVSRKTVTKKTLVKKNSKTPSRKTASVATNKKIVKKAKTKAKPKVAKNVKKKNSKDIVVTKKAKQNSSKVAQKNLNAGKL